MKYPEFKELNFIIRQNTHKYLCILIIKKSYEIYEDRVTWKSDVRILDNFKI